MINLPDDEPEAVEVVLLYLYTMKLPKFKTGNNILLEAAREAAVAAYKYGLVTLKNHAITRLVYFSKECLPASIVVNSTYAAVWIRWLRSV